MSNKEYTEEDEDEFFKALELDNEANENTKSELLASIIIVLSSLFVLWAVVALCLVIPDFIGVLMRIVMSVMTVGLLRANYQDLVNRDNVKK